jgi:DNA (cytosine-5)-methyltransferase 1
MKSLELFSGAGGLARGLELAGFKHAGFVESDKNACNSLRKNFNPNLVYEGDIRNFDLACVNEIDLIAGGPPCQPFSLGGKHKANEDQRDMFPYAAKAVAHHKPSAFIFENVKGLLRSSFSKYFEYVIIRMTYPEVSIKKYETWSEHFNRLNQIKWSEHSGIKYHLNFKLLNAADYGVPQIRERVFIVGIRSDLGVEWSFPPTTHSRDILFRDQFITDYYWQRHNIRNALSVTEQEICSLKSQILELPLETAKLPWQTVRDALGSVPHPASDHGISDHIFRAGAKTYPGHTGSYIDLPAKTLKAGGHGVPGGENMIRYEDGSVRYFTVYEGKLLQTFKSDFQIAGPWGEAMRQIGNAVPTQLAERIGQKLFNALSYRNEQRAHAA